MSTKTKKTAKKKATKIKAITPTIDLATYTVPKGKVLILRTCDKGMKSHGGFQWPRSGIVTALDWKATKECGNGLHGFLKGEGNGELASIDPDAVWIVAEVDAKGIIDLEGKVKFQSANVIFAGDRLKATGLIGQCYPGLAIVAGTATAGYAGTATAGYAGTATAGTRGTATAGTRGTATAGDAGTATAGDAGTATAGDAGTATAGYAGTATAGDAGTVILRWYDEKTGRYRFSIGYIGENGIEPNTKYKADPTGKLVKA